MKLISHSLCKWVLLLLVILGWGMGIPYAAQARDLARQTPNVKAMEMGTAEGLLRFTPNQLTFKNGSLYKLTLTNPSQLKHYFTAKEFADAVWTRKVEVGGVEIKGKVSEIELKPGASVDWFLVPLQSGTYPLVCTIPGHADAGMVGQLVISD